MDQSHRPVLFSEIWIKARAAPNEFIYFPGSLNTADPRSHHDEIKVPFLPRWVGRSLGLFHLPHDLLAKLDGIAHYLESERMLSHSRDYSQIAFSATCNHY